ncbi:hypothetical protein [Pseudoxanthomonas sp. PXM02]|uniref:hypothetical protein n=1 Tax=Pseudoxanthomonas sp. PXM02 TaxID=2769294 RepID=UPI001786B090|nr:hypothetical protein [Pseudoxanthomonas sp. PXM02]
MSRIGAAIFVVLSVAYPLVVYWAMGRFEPRWLAVLLLVLALLRAAATRQAVWLAAAAGAALLATLATVFNEALPLKLYPALVNAVLLVVFATSLVFPPSAVERIARLTEPDLPPEGVAYTRRVTQVWCVFFVFNGTLALVTALWMSDGAWALYNGLIAYVLIGVLFSIEWLVRRRVRARHSHG